MQWECKSARCTGSKPCAHVQAVRKRDPEAAAFYANAATAPPLTAFRSDAISVSAYSVLLPLSSEVKSRIAQGFDDVSRFPAAELAPAVPKRLCQCAQPRAYEQSGLVDVGSCVVYLTLGSITRKVRALDCPNKQPACRIVYDGQEHGLWMFSMQIALSIVLLVQCVEQVCRRLCGSR